MFGCVVYVVHKSCHVFILGYEDTFKDRLFLRSKLKKGIQQFKISYGLRLLGAY